jgi:hypothetical protein
MPVATRVSVCAGTSQIGIGFDRSPVGKPCPDVPNVSSAMLFQDPQSGHLPSHLGDWQPHFWQEKTVFCFT